MNYEEIGSGGSQSVAWNTKDLKEGAEVSGRYIEKKTNIGPNKSNMYILENGSDLWGIWGSTVVDAKFAMINIGKMVKIKYLGLKEGKNGKKFKSYSFWQGVDVAGDEGKVFDYGNIESKPKEEEEEEDLGVY